MGMMDYLIGKNVGQESGRVDTTQARDDAQRAESSARLSEIYASEAHDDAMMLAAQLNVMTKRFYRERRERRGWQRTAELRKLSLIEKAGMTADDVYEDQDRVSDLPGVSEHMKQFLDGQDKEIDTDTMGTSTSATNNGPSANNGTSAMN